MNCFFLKFYTNKIPVLILLLFSVFFTEPVIEANINSDSIASIVKKTKESDKPALYMKLANDLDDADNEIALQYAQKALAIYIKLGKKHEEAAARYKIGQNYYSRRDFKQSTDWYTQALRIFQSLKDNAGIAGCYNSIGVNNFQVSDYKEAQNLFELSLKYSKGKIALEEGRSYFYEGLILRKLGKPDEAIEKLKSSINPLKFAGDLKQLSKSYHFLGLLFYEKSQFPQAIEYYKTADSLRKSSNDYYGSALTLNNMGNVYWSWGKYDNAIAAYQDAMRIFEKIGITEGISSCLNNLGLIYNKMGNEVQSLESHKQALAIRKQSGDLAKVAESLNNIAIVQSIIVDKELVKKYGKGWQENLYKKLPGQKILSFFNECLTNYKESLRIRDSLDDKEKTAQLYVNIGTINSFAGNFNSAETYYKKADEIYKNYNNISDETSNKINLGIVYLKTGNYELSLQYLQEVLKVAKDHKLNELVKEAYKNLSDLYGDQGNSSKALEYYKLFTEIKDTLLNADNYRQMAELQTQYETESQKQKIQILKKDKALKETQIKQQKYTIFFFVLIILLVSIMVVLFYRQSKQRKLAQNT